MNLTYVDAVAPLPINLTSRINGDFVCGNAKPYYTFYCNIYGNDLIWYFNGEVVNSFQINDPSGHTYQTTYPSSSNSPTNILTTALTQVTVDTSGSESPFCVSTLTVQPYDDDAFNVIPFNVSCQTHCSDENLTTICQTQHFSVAGVLCMILIICVFVVLF